MRPIQVIPDCRHLLTRAATICVPTPLFRCPRKNHEVLNITVRNPIGNDAAHTDSPAGL